ncbi:uncharacterized protein si:busm1-57f23.1 [Corythoichthys intestinalis]|uniref:uncharacterized protein si:busm1-57f23.1 n=1 Tax=Corythoichthys intestinalis TaxID=161448 RepID=UPI0025A51D8D|nr:uncharacterized protein si:busm1-57f23.1 [Corythoichthys intestinalis]
MYLHLSVLLFLSLARICVGDELVEEVIVPRKVHLLGGWFDRSPELPEVQAATQHAVDMFNTHSKVKRLFKLVSITTAQTQVTNSINYRINAVLRKTKCLKGENHDLNNCKVEKKHLKCHFEVMFNPRNEKHEVQMHKCKRHIPDIQD